MEDNTRLIESLLERAAEYGKTSYELVRLKVVDKTSNGISTFIPNTLTLLIFSTVILFLNLGMALWLSKIFGELFYGFLLVAAIYVLIAFVYYFFMRKWFKRRLYDYFIRQLLK